MSGDLFSGNDAAKMNLALDAVPKEKVMERAIEVAVSVAKNSPVAVLTTMNTLRQQKVRSSSANIKSNHLIHFECDYSSWDWIKDSCVKQTHKLNAILPKIS